MIQPIYGTLQTIFADRVFRIPAYQRFYSWKAKQRDDLFSDIRTLARNSEDQHHFMATVVCYRTGETKSLGTAEYRIYDVVDGQQRLSTLILILKCIESALPADSEDKRELAKLLVKRDGQLILLQTNNLNAHIFNRFIREGAPPAGADIRTVSDRNLSEAIGECRDFVEEWSKGTDLARLIGLVLHRLGFVVYDTEDKRAVYTLFEVLNSRGLDVDWLDKTKSVLMGKAFELGVSQAVAEAEIGALQNIWAQIYEELAKEDVSGEEVLRITATLYYGPGQGKPRPNWESLELLRKHSTSSSAPSQISERLLAVAQKLTGLYGNEQLNAVTEILHARLLAVALMSAQGVTEAERKKLIDQWERVTFRIFGLYAKDSRTKVGDHVRLAYQIVTNDINTRTYNEIMAELHKLGGEYHIEAAIKEGLQGEDCYNRSPELCRYVLWNYEEYLANSLGGSSTVDEHERSAIWTKRASDSVEHIFPQNPSSEAYWRGKMRDPQGVEQAPEDNVGRIGNLLLVPTPLNSEAKNFSFDKKKKIYQRHHLRMIEEVCQETDWSLRQIEEREEKILGWARTRWRDV
jgi:hypothetical protein